MTPHPATGTTCGPVAGAPQDVLDLLVRHRSWAAGHSPPEDVHAVDASDGLPPGLDLLALRDADGVLLAVGGLQPVDAGHAELKAMHTVAEHRGRGHGEAVLAQLLAVARDRGLQRVSLETGSGEAFAPARRLYERAGFEPCEPFGQYVASPYSAFLTLALR